MTPMNRAPALLLASALAGIAAWGFLREPTPMPCPANIHLPIAPSPKPSAVAQQEPAPSPPPAKYEPSPIESDPPARTNPVALSLLVAQAEGAGPTEQHLEALRDLEAQNAPEGIAVAHRMLLSEADPNLRAQAAVLLAAAGGAHALGMLSTAALLVRSACMQGLGSLSREGFGEALEQLGQVFRLDPDRRIRNEAAFYLASPVPSYLLRDALLSEKDPQVRRMLPVVLIQNGAVWAIPLLIDAIRGDPDPQFRRASLLALGRLCHKGGSDAATFHALASLPQETWSEADRKEVRDLAALIAK